MIAYVDTSAFVPLLINEPTTDACRTLWDRSETVFASRLLHVEAAAALSQATVSGRMTSSQLVAARELIEDLWLDIELIELDDAMMRAASDHAVEFGLRGYDAVHCAAAARLAGEPDLVAASGDHALLNAWRELGLTTFDPEGRGGAAAS